MVRPFEHRKREELHQGRAVGNCSPQKAGIMLYELYLVKIDTCLCPYVRPYMAERPAFLWLASVACPGYRRLVEGLRRAGSRYSLRDDQHPSPAR